ncbi:ARM repeat-containing protein [Mytilinidion resinicola]|uniref:ARM repeat-containing protein n=1 Tax=Mytilinidion resinicola TaxID=574789 RepID=A0A6A6YNJ1_9PEZI|nr:ARM repeat-containing protein [Mytilinidion resinicola]KAF2810350.1 ARM repeat-containing protein [Mytilinidion resinicola]
MASTPNPDSPEAKELALVGKVEMRIALTDTDARLEAILKTYLAPLLLKLASPNVSVRNKVISICQHVNTRIKPQHIKLPVAALLKQFKENPDVPLIRHFDLLYIQQGISRLPIAERLELLPILTRGIAVDYSKSPQHGSQLFHLLLRLLGYFKLPPRGGKEDDELRKTLGVDDEDTKFLSFWFGKLILLNIVRQRSEELAANVSCPGVSAEEYKFLTVQGKPDAWNPTADGGLNLPETKVIASKFLASGMFADAERFLPALFASADTNSRISDVGDDILKRVLPVTNLEDREIVQNLLDVYFGSSTSGGPPSVGTPLKIKILGLLSKSVASTTFPKEISKIVEEGLISSYDITTPRSTGREASKFRSAIFLLVNFVARHGAGKDISTVAPGLVQNLKSFIEDQGWPTPNRDEDLELRGYGFETIGLLAKAAPESTLIEPTVSLLDWLFRSLREDTSGKDVAVSIEEALSSVLGAFTKPLEDQDTRPKFRQILLKYTLLDHPSKSQAPTGDYTDARKSFRSTRYAAARFANRCLPYHDVLARWIDILATSGADKEKHEVVEEGKKGLDPYWYRMLNATPDVSSEIVSENTVMDRFSFPDFDELVEYIFDQRHESDDVEMDEGDEPQTLHRVKGFRTRFGDAFPTAVKFCCQVLMQKSLEEKKILVEISTEWERKLEITISTDQRARQAVRSYTSDSKHSASLAIVLRAAFEEVIKDDTTDVGPLGDTFIDLCSLCPDDIWTQADLIADFRSLEPSILSNNSARRGAASHGFGLLVSHQSCYKKERQASLSMLLGKMQAWNEAVGGDLNKASGATLALAYYFSRLQWRQSTTEETKELLSTYLRTLFDMLKGATDTTLKEASHLSIDQLSLFQVLTPDIVNEYMPFVEVAEKIYDTAKSGKANAILALGHFGMIAEEKTGENVEKSDLHYVEEKLYSLHEVRQSEAQFSVGEAYSCLACGWDSKALAAAVDIENPTQERQQWDNALDTPHSPERKTTLSTVLQKTLLGCRNTKPSLKKASVIWLLCLLQFCGHRPEIQQHLPECQTAFKLCLSDRDEVVQEAASRGLGLVYEKGDRDLKDDLVRDLVGSFSDNRSKMAGSVTADTQLFEPGALPTGDGSITTYKDILSLASEVGDSSLVYRFMSLAANNSIWSSRAAFGRFGLSNVLSDSSVDGYLAENPKLYPKLYRYKFDPNPNVQRSMTDIWNALVKDSSATIDKHFDAIMTDLLESILTKEWRVRQACCAAVADLVQGRDLEKYEKYLDQIWDKCFKVLDDIKESVRAAAASLARVLTGILTRSLEAGDSSTKNASAMLERVLPFLLSTSGLESSAEEVRAFALHTLLQIIKKSNGKTLRPFIPDLVERLLGLLSALEPEAVNYIHLNAAKYNLTEQKLDGMRLASVRASPLTESIERCLDLLDESTTKSLISHLESAIKNAVGLPSKVGCSRILVTLSTRHNFLFRPYADSFLRLVQKCIHDRNETVASSYAVSAGYLSRLASDPQLLSTIAFTQSLYFNSDDDRSRLAAGDIVLAISKHAADRFAGVGASILPFVFVAKHDSNEEVAKLFADTWSDNVGGSRGVLLYLSEIVKVASQHLESPKWVLKHASARAVADAVMSITTDSPSAVAATVADEISKANAGIIWPALEKAMAGKTWEGKEVVLAAFVRFVERGRQLWGADTAVAGMVSKIAVREAKRVNVAYRPHAVKALGKVVKAREDEEGSAEVVGVVKTVVEDLIGDEDDEDKMDVDGGEAAGNAAV